MKGAVTITLAALAAPLALAGVATGGPAKSENATNCGRDNADLITPGKLTIGTDNPAFPPWFGGTPKKPWQVSDPRSGQGYESAVAYALAAEIGFKKADVEWVYVPFSKSFAPGRKAFDVFINQVSITPDRAKNVDFSSSYYNVSQAVVGVNGTPISRVKTVAGLKSFRLGAQVGTTSLDVIQKRVKPANQPRVYNTQALAVKALSNGQIDGIVVDTPTAFFVTAVQVENSLIIGQFPRQGPPEQFGMVMAKGSTLRSCVNRGITTLRTNKSLSRIEQKWLARAGAPFLK
jgi:polar amino acid transport system substrate-binding protein